jgi:hypothetical protein
MEKGRQRRRLAAATSRPRHGRARGRLLRWLAGALRYRRHTAGAASASGRRSLSVAAAGQKSQRRARGEKSLGLGFLPFRRFINRPKMMPDRRIQSDGQERKEPVSAWAPLPGPRGRSGRTAAGPRGGPVLGRGGRPRRFRRLGRWLGSVSGPLQLAAYAPRYRVPHSVGAA